MSNLLIIKLSNIQHLHTTSDINECYEMDNGGCDHSCVNIVGSYNCSCDTGFRLGNDSHTCEGMEFCIVYVLSKPMRIW